MTRKSRRELENALEDLDNDADPDAPARVQAGVTAEFVTFVDEERMTEEDLPDGWTVETSETHYGTALRVARPTDDEGAES